MPRPTVRECLKSVNRDVFRDFQRFLDSADVVGYYWMSLYSLHQSVTQCSCFMHHVAKAFLLFRLNWSNGLIMRWTRSQMSKSRLAQLVFLGCHS